MCVSCLTGTAYWTTAGKRRKLSAYGVCWPPGCSVCWNSWNMHSPRHEKILGIIQPVLLVMRPVTGSMLHLYLQQTWRGTSITVHSPNAGKKTPEIWWFSWMYVRTNVTAGPTTAVTNFWLGEYCVAFILSWHERQYEIMACKLTQSNYVFVMCPSIKGFALFTR